MLKIYNQSNIKTESGNVLFLILIAVALFAALSYAISSSNRSGSGNISSETTLIDTSEIIQYSSALENAITYLRVTEQCTTEELSFERAPFDGSDAAYINPSSPASFTCHLFNSKGGRVSSLSPPENSNDGRDWAYIETRVDGIGADQSACGAECNEIIAVLGGLTKGTCKKLNLKLTGSETIPTQNNSNNYETKKYIGSFNTGSEIDSGASGERILCTQATDGTYYFYHVLLPRG